MNNPIIDAILEASEAELRDAWGDEEFERLAEQGRQCAERALKCYLGSNRDLES